MRDLINLDLYPLDNPDSDGFRELVQLCRTALAKDGLFNLPGFVLQSALEQAVRELTPRFKKRSLRACPSA